MRQRLLIAMFAALCGSGIVSSSASADPGDYTIKSCFSDQRAHSSRAFSDFATRGMRIRRACNPRGRGLRGVVVGNVTRRKSVRRNARASMSITAAPGTVFKSVSWSGQAVRSDCAYGVYLYAVTPGRGGRQTLLPRSRDPYRNCAQSRASQAVASFTGRTNDVRGATRITQRIICRPRGRSTCRARGANYMKLQQVQVAVQDVQPPSVQITGGDLFNGWVRGQRSVTFAASDNTGVQSTGVLIGGVPLQNRPRSCNTALVVPCASGNDIASFETADAPQGTQPVSVEAVDASGLTQRAPAVTARIDNMAPLAVSPTLSGEQGWRSSSTFSAGWSNAPEPDRAPIAAVHYRLCSVSGQCESERVVSGADISTLANLRVPAPGEWTLRLWREDAAGNADANAASAPLTLRYDPEAPKVAIEAPSQTDPTAVVARVSDALSGVAPGGSIELSREGSGSWQALPTALEGDRLTARIDDAGLPPGRYTLRASGRDNAGNLATTSSRIDGSPASVTLPLRAEARLTAGFVRRSVKRRTVRRGGKPRTVRQRVTTLESTAHVRYNHSDSLSGRLATADGTGLSNAAVYVFGTKAGGQEEYLGLANTDIAGRFTHRIRGDASRSLRLLYLGTSIVRPTGQTVQMIVPARTSFRASRHRLVNGQRVIFRGRLAVTPAGVPGGKLIELQTRLSGRWQTFRNIRSNASGEWRSSYRFRRTRGRVSYRFRVKLPIDVGYPYGVGRSKSIKIGVRGR